MSRASTLQGLLFRQASKANASEGEDHNFFQIVNSKLNPEEVI